MTQNQAETIANVVIGVAVAGAAYLVLTDPGRRRTAWRMARTAIAAAGPWLMAQARQAWAESGEAAAPDPASSRQTTPGERV